MNKQKFFITVVLGTLIFSHIQSVHAQSTSVSLRPALQVVYAKPGTSVQIPIVITNTDSPTSYAFQAVRLIPKGTRGDLEPILKLPDGITMSFPEKEAQFLGIGAEKKTMLTITIDKTVAPQDYYIGFMLESVGKKHSEGKSSIAIAIQPISTVLLTITNTGVLQNSGFINSFTVANNSNVRFFDSHDEIPVDLIVGNSGNNWTYVSGTLTASDSFGNQEQFSVPKQRVLANSKRLARSDHTNDPYHSLILDGFHIGKYAVKTHLVFEGKSGSQTRITTFVSFPFKLTALLLGLFIIAGVVVSKLNRPRRVQRVVDAAPHRL